MGLAEGPEPVEAALADEGEGRNHDPPDPEATHGLDPGRGVGEVRGPEDGVDLQRVRVAVDLLAGRPDLDQQLLQLGRVALAREVAVGQPSGPPDGDGGSAYPTAGRSR